MKYYWIFACLPISLIALPEGGVIKRGEVLFTQKDAHLLHITASDKAILEFSSFNIAPTEQVEVLLPSRQSTLLSRVHSEDPSTILGKLSANGRIFLVNPRGVYFGKEAIVDVGSLVASTLDIADEHFTQERYVFFAQRERGSVINEGLLRAYPEGAIILLAPFVHNEGTILADTGKVVLASSEKITLDFSGDGLISFVLEEDFIEPTGRQIRYDPKDAGCIVKNVLNVDGLVEAACLLEEGGMIRLAPSSKIYAEEIRITSAKVHIEGELIGNKHVEVRAHEVLALRDRPYQPLLVESFGDMILISPCIDILAWEHPQSFLISAQNMTLISDNPISADSRFFAGGNFSLLSPDGIPADFKSLFDPIVTSVGSVTFGSYNGTSLKVVAAENITCTGTITITGPDAGACFAGPCIMDPDCGTLTTKNALILLAGTQPQFPLCNPVPQMFGIPPTTFNNPGGIGSTLTLSGDITGIETALFKGAISLAAPITITSTGGMLFDGTIDGAFDLTLVGAGNANVISVSGTIGGVTPLASLTVNGNMSFAANAINAGSAMLGDMTTLIVNIGPVATTEMAGLTVTATDLIQVTDATVMGGPLLLRVVTPGAGHAVNIGGTIVADGDITIQSLGDVLLYQPTTTLTSNEGSISILGVQVGGNGVIPEGLTLSAPTGNITVTSLGAGIGFVHPPLFFHIISAEDVFLSSITTGVGGVIVHANTLTLNGNITTSGGPIILDAATTLTQPTVLSSAGGQITLSTVDGMQNLLIDAGTGILSFAGAVGSVTPLNMLTASGSFINIASDITVLGILDLTGPVILVGPSRITAGGSITIDGSINGASNLTLVSSDQEITITGNIGRLIPIGHFVATGFHTFNAKEIFAASINIDYMMSTLGSINVSQLVTTGLEGIRVRAGDQILMQSAIARGGVEIETPGQITLTDNSTISSEIAHVQITGSGLDAAMSGIQNLTLSAPNGDVTIVTTAQLGIGTGTPFRNVLLLDAQTASLPAIQVMGGNVNLNAEFLELTGPFVMTTGGSIIIDGGFTVLTSPMPQFTFSSNGGLIELNSDIFSNVNTLIVNAGSGSVVLGGTLSSSLPGAQIHITASTITQDDIVSTDGGDVTYTADVLHLGGNIRTAGGNVAINADVVLEGTSTINTENGGDVTFAGDINDSEDLTHSLTVLTGSGVITFGGDIGNVSPPSTLAATTSSNIVFAGTFYGAESQIYTADMDFDFTAASLVTVESFGGRIAFNHGDIQLSAGADLLIKTHGGDFIFDALFGTVGENVDILAGNGKVTLGTMGAGGGDLNSILVFGGKILFNGPIQAASLTVMAACIANADTPEPITILGNAIFDALCGTVGEKCNPIDVDAGFLVFAGAPKMLANFIGSTLDNTIHPILCNTPCPLIFNDRTLIGCPSPCPSPCCPKIPARYFYVQGIYSQYKSLASYSYFLPEVVTKAYVFPRFAPLFWTSCPFLFPPLFPTQFID